MGEIFAVAEDSQINASHDAQRCSLVSAMLQAKKREAEKGPLKEVSEYLTEHNIRHHILFVAPSRNGETYLTRPAP